MIEKEQQKEWKLDSTRYTHTDTYIPREDKRKKRKGKKHNNQDHKGMTQECMTQECVDDVKRRTKRE